MNLRFDCFGWNKWNSVCVTSRNRCNTDYSGDKGSYRTSTAGYTFCNTGTRGYRNRRPRGAPERVCANLARRARRRALCGRGGARRRSGVAA